MTARTDAWIGLGLSGGRYRVASLLGEGGMGFAYRARDRNLDTDVVIKVPRRALLDDPDFAHRFAREIRALVQLVHPHIVRISDAGEHDGLPYAVMQYLPGGSLEDCRVPLPDGRAQPVSPASLADWLPVIAKALDFVHSRQIVHRDIKPGNILFDEHGNAYLSDFGIAKALATAPGAGRGATMTSAGNVVGTPEYMALELIMGQPFDGRADQYALAVTVYELLAGRRPFEETGTAVMVRLGQAEGPPELHRVCPTIPEGLSRAIHRGLEKDPVSRYPSCGAFAAAVLAEARVVEPTREVAAAGRIVLACPSCGGRVLVPESAGGHRGRCSGCQARFRIAVDRTSLAPLVEAPSGSRSILLNTLGGTRIDSPPIAPAAARRGPTAGAKDGVSRPTPPAAQPSSTDSGTRPGRGQDAPAVPRSEPEDARRRRWWAVVTAGGLVMAAVVVGIVAWAIRPDNKGTLRELGQLARTEDGSRPMVGGAQAETGPAPEPPAADPIEKDNPPIAGVADGRAKKRDPVGDAPAEEVTAARSVPAVAPADPVPPANPLPTGTRAPAPDFTTKPAAPEPRAAPIAAPAPATDLRAAEQVLADAGLTPLSNSYVLGGEIKADELASAIPRLKSKLMRMMKRYRDLEGQYNAKRAEESRLRSEARRVTREYNSQTKSYEEKESTPDSNKLSEANSRANEAHRIMGEGHALEGQIAEEQWWIQEVQVQYRMLVSQTLQQYAALAARPEIKAALRALNRGRQPKLALGPREAYQQNLVRASLETLTAIGLREERGSYYLRVEAEFIERANATDLLRREVGMHEKKLRELQSSSGPAGSDPGAAPPQGSSDGGRPADPAGASASAKGQAAPTPAEEVRRVTGFLLDRRAQFVRHVSDLRRLADEILARQQALAQDVEVRDCLAEINRVRRDRIGLGTKPGFKVSLQKLEEMEAMIRTDRVPLRREGEARWVVVTVNDDHLLLMDVAPEAATVRLPAGRAATIGVTPAPEANVVAVRLADGREVLARPARLRSVRLGPFTETDVACVILPEEVGDSPPTLGTSFLGRFVSEVDPEAGTLTLTRVVVSPPEGR